MFAICPASIGCKRYQQSRKIMKHQTKCGLPAGNNVPATQQAFYQLVVLRFIAGKVETPHICQTAVLERQIYSIWQYTQTNPECLQKSEKCHVTKWTITLITKLNWYENVLINIYLVPMQCPIDNKTRQTRDRQETRREMHWPLQQSTWNYANNKILVQIGYEVDQLLDFASLHNITHPQFTLA